MFSYGAVLAAVLVALAVAFSNAKAASVGAAGDERSYVVKHGDTLWDIAVAYYDGDPRSAVWHIQERNGLASAALVPGMTLHLPP